MISDYLLGARIWVSFDKQQGVALNQRLWIYCGGQKMLGVPYFIFKPYKRVGSITAFTGQQLFDMRSFFHPFCIDTKLRRDGTL